MGQPDPHEGKKRRYKNAVESFEMKHSPVKDAVGTPSIFQLTLQMAVLVELLVEKDIITDDEWFESLAAKAEAIKGLVEAETP